MQNDELNKIFHWSNWFLKKTENVVSYTDYTDKSLIVSKCSKSNTQKPGGKNNQHELLCKFAVQVWRHLLKHLFGIMSSKSKLIHECWWTEKCLETDAKNNNNLKVVSKCPGYFLLPWKPRRTVFQVERMKAFKVCMVPPTSSVFI